MTNLRSLILACSTVFLLGLSIGWLIGKGPSEKAELNMTYALFRGQAIKGKDVADRIKSDLQQIEKNKYQLKKSAVEELVREKVFAEKPELAKAPADFLKAEITPEELARFLKERGLVESKLSKKERENILNNMKLQKSKATNASDLEKIMTGDLKWLLPIPLPKTVLSTGSTPRLGSLFAPVKLVVASNYHCPFCPQAETRLAEIRKQFGDKLKIYYRFSMREPDNSIVRSAAEATMCADDQGKFWEYRDSLAKEPGTDVARYAEVAKGVGLNIEKWQKCLTERKHKADVENDIRDTEAAGIETAPMFVINGKAIAGQSSLSELEAVIENELQ